MGGAVLITAVDSQEPPEQLGYAGFKRYSSIPVQFVRVVLEDLPMKRSIVILSVLIAMMYAEPADANRKKEKTVMQQEIHEEQVQQPTQKRRPHPHWGKKHSWPSFNYSPFRNRVEVQRIYTPNHGAITVTTNRQQWSPYRRGHRRGSFYGQRSPITVYPLAGHIFSRRQPFHCDHGISFGASFPFNHSYRSSCPYHYFSPRGRRRTSITVVAPKVNSYVGVDGNYDEQGLAQRINAKIQGRPDLLSQVDSLTVTQQGGQVIYSGVVQNAAVVEQLEAIAWQEVGTESVNIDQLEVIEREQDFGQRPTETVVVKSSQSQWSSLRTELETLNQVPIQLD